MKYAQKPHLASGLPQGVKSYDWALRQLRVPQAHRIIRGSPQIIVAVIDLGYRHHPDLDGHLWKNPRPTRGDVHGWDCADDDASLEPVVGPHPDSTYFRGHHVFVAGEVAAVAPECPIMIVRVGYGKPDSWASGIRYAVAHGARVLIIPHDYLHGEKAFGFSLFYHGTDFAYPFDNPGIRKALDEAYDSGCLIVRGTADNRGRRVACAMSAVDMVLSVGSSNRRGVASDVCANADYVEIAAPSGQRKSKNAQDQIWGCGGDQDYIPLTGGCMASGFAGAVAALVWSRFQTLTNDQVRQILQSLHIEKRKCELVMRRGKPALKVILNNRGALDINKAIIVAYDGDPCKPVSKKGGMDKPVILRMRQIGHSIAFVRGLHSTELYIGFKERPNNDRIWLEAYSLDRHGSEHVARAIIRIGQI